MSGDAVHASRCLPTASALVLSPAHSSVSIKLYVLFSDTHDGILKHLANISLGEKLKLA